MDDATLDRLMPGGNWCDEIWALFEEKQCRAICYDTNRNRITFVRGPTCNDCDSTFWTRLEQTFPELAVHECFDVKDMIITVRGELE